jgi:hypothetical protein
MPNKYYLEWLEYQKKIKSNNYNNCLNGSNSLNSLNSSNGSNNVNYKKTNHNILSRSIDKITNQEDAKKLFALSSSNNYQPNYTKINKVIIVKIDNYGNNNIFIN